MSNTTVTNNGGDGSYGDRDSGDDAWRWLLKKRMNERKWQW